jgi:RimJ/RimL family protein N-acetyltransferase
MVERVDTTYTYPVENCTVSFFLGDTFLYATVDTTRLHMRSIQEEDAPFYTRLFSDAKVVEKFGLPGINAPLYAKKRLYAWRNRWEAKSPYSALTIFNKEKSEPLGYVAAEPGVIPGSVEIGVALMPHSWRQGFGSEVVSMLVKAYLSSTVKEGYLVEKAPLTRITANARSDNIACIKILQKILHQETQPIPYEAEMRFFTIGTKF